MYSYYEEEVEAERLLSRILVFKSKWIVVTSAITTTNNTKTVAVYAGLVLFPEFCNFSGALFIYLYIKYISFKTEFFKSLSSF